MKTIYIFMLLIVSAPFISGQNTAEEIVKNELAFSEMCGSEGLYKSFTAYLTPDCIVFRPHPRKAKDVYKPEMSSKGLTWKPVFVEPSKSGDFGYDTGPWKFTRDTVTAYGHFISIWEKQADGNWRVIFDAGISHDKIDYENIPVPNVFSTSKSGEKVDSTVLKEGTDNLRTIDELICTGSKDSDLNEILLNHFSDDVRVYRDGAIPQAGIKYAEIFLGKTKFSVDSKVDYCRISSAADIGYTIGTGKILSGEKKDAGFAYMRIWQKKDTAWKIVLDLLSLYE